MHRDFFRFFDACGKAVATYTPESVLAEAERDWPSKACICGGIDPQFKSKPALSDGGWAVAFEASGTGRRVRFFLPLAMEAPDGFEAALARFLSRSSDELAADAKEVEARLPALDDESVVAREAAVKEILARGIAAWAPVEALSKSGPATAKALASTILAALKPWRERADRRRDLRLLAALLEHPDAGVKEAAGRRLARIVPGWKDRTPAEARAWVAERGASLAWDAERDSYK